MAERFNQKLYDIGQNIRKFRMAKGMTQTDLALAMDTNKSAVSKWETGDRILKLDTVLRLADELDVTPSELLYTGAGDNEEWETVHREIKLLPEEEKGFILRTVQTLLYGIRSGKCG